MALGPGVQILKRQKRDKLGLNQLEGVPKVWERVRNETVPYGIPRVIEREESRSLQFETKGLMGQLSYCWKTRSHLEEINLAAVLGNPEST